MKKFYLLLSAACVAVSASAVEKEMATPKAGVVKAELRTSVAAPFGANQRVAIKNAVGDNVKRVASKAKESVFDYVYFRAADNIGSVGMDPTGHGYAGIGYASCYGDLVFDNFSTNVKSYDWSHSYFGGFNTETKTWDIKHSSDETFAMVSEVGEVMAPSLEVEFTSGSKGSCNLNVGEFLCGGSTRYWFGSASEMGLTFYQNTFLENPQGYTGSTNRRLAYAPGGDGFASNGFDESWMEDLQASFEGQTVSDLVVNNFTIMLPKPASTYFFTKGWEWVSCIASSATQLISYVYPVDDEGVIAEMPIAIGYAAVPKGESDMLVFEYNPLNEDGDEIEGEIFVDTALAFTIEGFVGNNAISQLAPVSGFYPFDINAFRENEDLVKTPDTYLDVTFNVAGETYAGRLTDYNLYYYDQSNNATDRETISYRAYSQFTLDAEYAFVNAVEKGDVTFPLTGGDAKVDIEALYYITNEMVENGYYEISAPEWVSVTINDPDTTNGLSSLSLKAEAGEDRSGVLSITGFGVKCDIQLVQGEGGAVGIVTAEGEATYYDLAGRKVANPEKGIYVKVNGNKAEKVVL